MSPIALKVGELYATMRLDDGEFNQGLDGSKRRFDGLRSAIGTGVRAIATGFAAVTTTVVGLGVAAGKVGLEYNSLRQTGMAALTTLTGSAEGAVEQMARLDEFGRTSWVMRDVLIQAQTQMMGFGIETEKVIPYLDALQEGVAAVGGSNEDFSELAQIMAQIEGQSKITAEELRMFGMRGIDAAGLIGEAMGKTGGQIREDISNGALDATDALDALASAMSTKFEGATQNVRDTWSGAVANMQGAWRDFGAALAEPLVDPTGGGYLVEWVNEVANAFWDLEAKTRPFVALLVDRFRPGIESVTPLLRDVSAAINSWDISNVNRQLDELGRYAPIIAGVATAMFSLGTQSIPIIGAINPLVAGFAALAATSPEIRTMLSEFASSLSPLLPVMGDFAVLLADTALLTLHELTPALSDLLIAGGDLASTLGMALVPAVGDLLVAAAPLVTVLADVISWFAELPGPVQVAMLSFMAFRGPIDDLVSAVSGPLRTAFSSMSEYMAASRAIAQETGGQISGMRAGMEAARVGASNLGTALRGAFIASGIGLAITGVVTALSYFITSQAEASRKAEELRGTLDEQTGALTENSHAWAAKEAQEEGWLDLAEKIGASTQDVTAAMLGNEEAAARVQAAIDAVTVTTDEFGIATYRTADGTRIYRTDLLKLEEGLASTAETTRQQQDAQRQLADAQQDAADGADAHREAQERLRDELNEGIDATLSAAEADLRYREAVDRTEEALRRHEEAQKDLEDVMADTNATTQEQEAAQRRVEQSSRGVEQALIQQIRQVENDLGAKARNNATTEELLEIARQARDDYIALARQFGASAEEAEAMADQFGLIPEDLVTRFRVEGFDDAERQITRFIDRNGRRQISIKVNTTTGTRVHFPGVGGGVTMQADGGLWDGTVRAFANGGIDHAGRPVARVPQMVQGGRNILWGEPETGWESYISGKPSARARNLAVMDETARRLGGFFVRPMADGGTTGTASRPVAAPQAAAPVFPDRVELVVEGRAMSAFVRPIAQAESQQSLVRAGRRVR